MLHNPAVLLADDEDTFLQYTAHYLRDHNFSCDACHSGDECLELLKQKTYDVVVSDIVMQGNTDLSLIKSIAEAAPGLPVIVVTAYPSLDTAMKSISLPVYGYLVKPVDPEQLLDRIKTALVHSRLRQLVSGSQDRLRQWISDVNTIGKSLEQPRGEGKELPVETFLGLTFANIITSLNDLNHFIDIILDESKTPNTCGLLNCPRLQEQVKVIQHTISVLEKTKSSFKSKDLGELRRKLELFVKDSAP